MTPRDKTTLKSYFEQGDIPTQTQFGDLIDSMLTADDIETPVPADRVISAQSPLRIDGQGGADLSQNRTLSILPASNSNAGSMSSVDKVKLDAISGTNTGDDSPNVLYSSLVTNATHTGDVTGSEALTISERAVTLSKMEHLPANTIIGNDTGNTQTPKALTLAETKAWLGISNGAYVLKSGDTMTGPLIVTGTTVDAARGISSYQTSLDNVGAQISAYKSRNGGAILSADRLGIYNFYGYDGSAYFQSAMMFAYVSGVNWDSTHHGSAIDFRTTDETESATIATRMTIYRNGNVGIGDATPLSRLVVAGQTFLKASDLKSWDPGDGSGAGLRIGYSLSNDFGYINAHNTGVASKNLIFQTGGGNVGIGTTAPMAHLDVYGTSQAVSAITDAGSRLGMLAINAASAAGNAGGALLFGNSQSIVAGSLGWAALKALLTDGSGNTKGDLVFLTRNAVSDSALSERMRITAGGSIGIGTNSPQGRFHVKYTTDQNAFFHSGASYGGTDGIALVSVNDANNAYKQLVLGASSIILNAGGSQGNVGIGTGSPGAKLHVYSIATPVPAPTYPGLVIIETAPTSISSAGGLEFRTSDYQSGYGSRIIAYDIGGIGQHLSFQVRSNSASWTTAITIDPGGKLGVGTTGPLGTLNVSANGSSSRLYISDADAGSNLKHLFVESYVGDLYFNRIDDNNSSNVLTIMKLTNSGDVVVGTGTSGNVSAGSFTDRTPWFEGDALAQLRSVRGKQGEIDHTTLPDFAKAKHKQFVPYNAKHPEYGVREVVPQERDLGAMITLLTIAVQQLDTRLTQLGA